MGSSMAVDEDKVNILLVDDQPARLLTYESILAQLGQNLISVRSGEAALKTLLVEECAVILLDVRMPGMDGFETATLIHEHPRYQRVPIIFVTGAADSELDRIKGYTLGAIDFVGLPVVPEILRSKVSILVELYRHRRELQRSNAAILRDSETQQAESARQLALMNHHLQEANDALQSADRHKDEFLAILAHELRNPLASIRSAVDLLHQLPTQDARAIRSAEVIDRQTGQLTKLVDDLLDVSRIKRGTLNLSLDRHEVSSIVERAVEIVQTIIQDRCQHLSIECPANGVMVVGDLTRLVQVVSNLLNNAAKYTNPDGHIRLRIAVDGEMVEIQVADTGIGIAAEALPRLFTLFSRVHDNMHSTPSGLGIGLALVRQIVELHGGEVRARSQGLGRGSEFTVRLPLAPAAAAVRNADAAASDLSSSSPCRILVADDNEDALQSLVMLLDLEGHEVRAASDGASALDIARSWLPQIALLDIGMPGMSGYEVARGIRSSDEGKAMILVALSGWGQPQDRAKAVESGFNAHVAKPIGFDDLRKLIARLRHAAVAHEAGAAAAATRETDGRA